MEFILELLFEFIIQFGVELLVDGGLHFSNKRRKTEKRKNLVRKPAFYLVLGAALGGVSLLVFPDSFLSAPESAWLNLLLTPIAVGGMMAFIGKLRAKAGKEVAGLETFFCGWLFAFAMALVRFIWAA